MLIHERYLLTLVSVSIFAFFSNIFHLGIENPVDTLSKVGSELAKKNQYCERYFTRF